MSVVIQPAQAADAPAGGQICFNAFRRLADRHAFPPDFPSAEVATGLLSMLIAHEGFHGVVARLDGTVVGSNFMDERAPILGIGPISVDPTVQQKGVGRALMAHMLTRAEARQAAGVRLVQAGYNNQSLCLYTRLGFRTREPLSLMNGTPPRVKIDGFQVRPAVRDDSAACDRLCRTVHGFARTRELADAIGAGTARVVERQGRLTGYATDIAFSAHAVGETPQDLMALIGAASRIDGPGILVPTRNHELFAWALANGLGLVFQMTLMSIGLYQEPTGAWLPSILF